MKKTSLTKKLTSLFVVGAFVVCMAPQAFAATLPTVEIWKPDTAYQTTSPNIVYMDYDDMSDWSTSGEHLEKIAWKFFDNVENPDIVTAGNCGAEQYLDNDDTKKLMYSYNFNANNIDQSLIENHPYYLGIKTETDGEMTTVDMGCRTKFPVAMEITIPSGLDANEFVTVEYVEGSCDGYVKCKANSWNEIQDNNYGDANYLDGYENSFEPYDTEVDEEGNVTFTTYHGGEYIIYYQ